MPAISNARILFIATHGFEQSELMTPLRQLKEQGARVEIATPDAQTIRGWKDKEWGEAVDADLALADVEIDQYDALVIPGGVMNPDLLRQNDDAVTIVREANRLGLPIAAICHGPWMLAEADIIEGAQVTSWPSLQTDLENAGAFWVDEEVVVDENLITSRKPDDLDAFVHAIVAAVNAPANAEAE
jgi:protease I